MQDTNKSLESQLVDAYTIGLCGVLEYVSTSTGQFDSLLQYERDEYMARIKLILKALAEHFEDDDALIKFIRQGGLNAGHE